MRNNYHLIWTGLVGGLLTIACQQTDSSMAAMQRIDSLEQQLKQAYRPGFGDVMRGSIQVHHSNLWFAGTAENWALADHMVKELEEGFHHLKSWQEADPKSVAIDMIYQPLNNLSEVIEKQDKTAFKKGFITLTNTCNACHKATGNEIYVITVPQSPAFTNQSFDRN